ncbi:MAG: hypothetical protein IIB62_11800 [Proteobacteria bacterium]|nr:hypothetical protein [Pseudomonadota bacterium]
MPDHKLTRAQLNAHVMLREAIQACQPEYVLNWIRVELTDDIRIRGSELEKFGDLCARAGHEKVRNETSAERCKP